MPLRTPQWTVAATLVGALAVTAGCQPITPGSPGRAETPSARESRTAADRLDRLTVAKAGSMRGYSRDKFPHWRSTGENCDVRDSVLRRNGTNVKVSGCNVVAGTWTNVYDGRTLDSPSKVEIDHLVPLANAWRSGASSWSTTRREDFANDLNHPELVPVSQTSNRAKGDQDPSMWKPPARGNWCEYAANWIAVKSYWKLTVTSAEKAALKDMLERC